MSDAAVPSWMRELADAAAAGRPMIGSARMSGKTRATIDYCAVLEAFSLPWDVIGPKAPAIRREAREIAARLTDTQERP